MFWLTYSLISGNTETGFIKRQNSCLAACVKTCLAKLVVLQNSFVKKSKSNPKFRFGTSIHKFLYRTYLSGCSGSSKEVKSIFMSIKFDPTPPLLTLWLVHTIYTFAFTNYNPVYGRFLSPNFSLEN